MIRSKSLSALALAIVVGGAASLAQAQLTTTRIATGLSRPVFLTSPPGDFSRLFIVEQRGSAGVASRADIRILNTADNSINATPFLTINGVSTGSEQGLLGLAFDPNYATNGYFYVNYTNPTTNIVRFRVDPANPNVALASSATTILTQTQPFSNHNGGWLAFGPDNYLYIALGDGGSAGDPNGNAFNRTSTFLGKMLRIDVSTTPYSIPPTNPYFGSTQFRQEIWAYGLRNPWRNAFDRATGELYIADVGQNLWEEINVQPAGVGGQNYGWRCFEGNSVFTTTWGGTGGNCPPANDPSLTFPVHVYSHSEGCSVTGGYVYRGQQIPWLRGSYFFAEYCNNWIRTFRYTGANNPPLTDRTAELAPGGGLSIGNIVSFAEDQAGEMYILDQTGFEIYRITNRCYANCDGSSTAPTLNAGDFTCFLNEFRSGNNLSADLQIRSYANCDNSTTPPVLNAGDFTCFLNKFRAGCP